MVEVTLEVNTTEYPKEKAGRFPLRRVRLLLGLSPNTHVLGA